MIIPPPPSKSSVKSVSVKIKGDTDSDSLGRTIGKNIGSLNNRLCHENSYSNMELTNITTSNEKK